MLILLRDKLIHPDKARISLATDKMHDFPRPTLAVDTALLTVDTDRRQLLVVEMEREESGKWALPGTFVREREILPPPSSAACATNSACRASGRSS